jgi:hypothetical protein
MGDRQAGCQIYCWVTNNQYLDTVEGSTSSKAEKGAAHRAGAGDVEAPASPTKDDDENLN